MRLRRLRFRIATVAIGVVLMVTGIPEAWASSMWKVQTTVNPSSFDDELNGVSQSGTGETWAVGTAQSANGWRVTLIEHHPGGSGSWTQQTSPAGVGNEDNVLQGVRVRSVNNVWAVGWSAKTSTDGTIDPTTLAPIVVHFNGTSWKNVSLPTAIKGKYSLEAVGASANNNVWAAGSSGKVIRFTGTTWVNHSIPAGSNVELRAITVLSPSDVWVAGEADVGLGGFAPLLEHWNGSKWKSFQTSNFGSGQYFGIEARSTDNVWAVGLDDQTGTASGAVLAHWDGTSWTRLTTPSVGQAGSTELFDVRPVSSTDVIAVGDFRQSASPHNTRTLIEHYNGSTVAIETSPNVGSTSNRLLAISGVSTLHAVGDIGVGLDNKTLAMKCTQC
jgi:hypothetical protein